MLIMGVLVVFPLAAVGEGTVPRAIGSFALGQDIAELEAAVRMESVLPLRYQEYINEVEIKPPKGLKSGLVAYGLCAQPGKVVRIKLKYRDSSREFYDELLERIKQRFGRPSEYNGDPFHIVISWKWSFVDPSGQHISLNLAHNTRDVEEKFGNTIKLTLISAIEQERACYLKQNPAVREREADQKLLLKKMTPQDWDRLVPR
jgi:hypothetical protein